MPPCSSVKQEGDRSVCRLRIATGSDERIRWDYGIAPWYMSHRVGPLW
jgi:hypothetical protein